MKYAFGPTPRAPGAPPLAVPWVHCICGSYRAVSDPCPCRRLSVETPAPSWRVQVGLLLASWLLGCGMCWLWVWYWAQPWCGVP
jgi:hypothetical protein